ncbi:TPA: ABC transporter ATP-binding protein [Vibrio vulnificus]|nr:ABC transporter ATP-binding protein [Vibrio vulnificus]
MIKNYFMLEYVKNYKLQISIGIGLILLLPFLSLPIPIMMMNIIDIHIPNRDLDSLKIYGFIIVLLFSLSSILSYIQTVIFYKYNCKIVKDIRLDLFSKVFNGELQKINTFKPGDICARIEDDIKNLSVLFVNNVANLVKDVVTFLVCFFMMMNISLYFSIVFFMVLVFYAIITVIFKSKIENLSKVYIKALSECKVSLIDFVSNLNFIKINQFSLYTVNQYDEKNTIKQDSNIALGISRSKGESLVAFLVGAFPYFTLLSGAFLVVNGHFTIGSIIAFNSYFGSCIGPLKNITSYNFDLSQAKVSLQRMNEIFELNDEQSGESRGFHGLEIKNVSYAVDDIVILDDINVNIERGNKLAIIGRSGSGKSTLRKIITGEISPQTGGVYSKKERESFTFSGMFTEAESYIYSSSIMENIVLQKQMNYDKYNHIIDICLLNDCIRDNNIVINLSHGQQQKLSLARALYQGADFLVLDESLSNIDLIDLNKIIDNLLKIEHLTIVCITHNLNLSNKFDSRLVMREGKGYVLDCSVDTEALI